MAWGATCQAERKSSRREAVQLLLSSNPNTLVFHSHDPVNDGADLDHRHIAADTWTRIVALTAQRRWIKRPMVDALTDDDGPREEIADLIRASLTR